LARCTAVAAAPVALAAVAALAIVPATAAAFAVLPWAAVLPKALVPLAQLLHAHLQALAGELASGHRAAFAVAAALFAAAAPFATVVAPAVVAVVVAQLLAALLQACAHRLEALFGLLQAFAHFGARGRLAVLALRLLAFLGGGEREEQTEHEHQAFHGDHLRGRWKAASYAPRAATPTPPARRSCRAFVRADAGAIASPMPWAKKHGASPQRRGASGRGPGLQRVAAASV
jgi:hypothetical protein